MRAKGIMTVMLAAGILLLAPGMDAARADQSWGHRHKHQHAYQGQGHGYGGWGRQHFGDHRHGGHAFGQRHGGHAYGKRHGGHAYGPRAHSYRDSHLTKHQRKKLRHLRHRFDNERAFRHYLRHHKPRLFGHYMAHKHQRRAHAFDHRGHRAQRYVWTRHRAY
ncbi:MAG: hypothetical protein R3285_05045 [Kiloniellales bacterium]|nr:hypothetical protein [Kiloniellales bacterium]